MRALTLLFLFCIITFPVLAAEIEPYDSIMTVRGNGTFSFAKWALLSYEYVGGLKYWQEEYPDGTSKFLLESDQELTDLKGLLKDLHVVHDKEVDVSLTEAEKNIIRNSKIYDRTQGPKTLEWAETVEAALTLEEIKAILGIYMLRDTPLTR